MKIKKSNEKAPHPAGEDSESVKIPTISKKELKKVLTSVSGIGAKKFDKIIEEIGSSDEVVGVLEQSPSILLNIKGITKELIAKISEKWNKFKSENN